MAEFKAIKKSVRMSPRKARLVVDLIRGKKVGVAVAILKNVESTCAEPILKTLNSAVANAVNNNGAKVEELYIKEARVDAGPVMKRHMFDSRSHIGHNDKRTSHIVITVASR